MKGEYKLLDNRDLVKIKFENKQKITNKYVNRKGLSYEEFANKLTLSFNLARLKHYRLYYFDLDQEDITINNQQDYQVFNKTEQMLVLYLEQINIKELDFRRQLKLVQKEDIQTLIDMLHNKNSQILSYKKELAQLNHIKMKKIKIENTIQQLTKELQAFKITLQKQAGKNLNQKLKDFSEVFNKQHSHIDEAFQHKAYCQSTKMCNSKKKIMGVKYSCIICSMDFCQNCADEEFKSKNCMHGPTHPMIMIRDPKWQSKIKIDVEQCKRATLKLSSQTNNAEKQKEMTIQQKITQLANLMYWDQKKTRAFVAKYPHLSFQKLVEKAFS